MARPSFLRACAFRLFGFARSAVCALRYFNAAGAHSSGLIGEVHDPETHLIPLVLKAVLGVVPAGQSLWPQSADGEGPVSATISTSRTLGAAHVLALEYLAAGGESVSLNLGTGAAPPSKRSWTASSASRNRCASRTGSAARWRSTGAFANATRAKEVLGWVAKRDVDEILRRRGSGSRSWKRRITSCN